MAGLIKGRPLAISAKSATFFNTNLTPTELATVGSRDRENHHHPLSHWASTGSWPMDFASMSAEELEPSKKRRRASSHSLTECGVSEPEDHDDPQVYVPAQIQEADFVNHGVVMNLADGQACLHPASKLRCESLLRGRYAVPRHLHYPLSTFPQLCNKIRGANKGRIFRDLTPAIVPSAEHLYLRGHGDLKDVVEEIFEEWPNSDSLGGPAPRPNFAIGIGRSAFTDQELARLNKHATWARTTLFSKDMYFPFLLCEAKSHDEGWHQIDLQNAQGGSMAVSAVMQLHRALGSKRATQLSGHLLVFSISHDHEWVKIHGHYAIVARDQEDRFYRYNVASFNLHSQKGCGRQKTYNFVRELYHTFYPEHLKRIKDALAEMEEVLAPQSIESDQALESQEVDLLREGMAGLEKLLRSTEEENEMLQKLLQEMGKENELLNVLLKLC